MIDLSARSFLFDLRVIRRLLKDSTDSLVPWEYTALALESVERIIERIEDVHAFLQAVQAEDLPESPEACVGPDLGHTP